MLNSIPYEHVAFDAPTLGKRQKRPADYVPSRVTRNMVPSVFGAAEPAGSADLVEQA